MSNRIHMETEMIRGLVRQLNAHAITLDHKASQVRLASIRLSSAWWGTETSQFIWDLNRWLRSYQTEVEELHFLIMRLSHEVDEWEECDEFGASQWRGQISIGQPPSFFPLPVFLPWLPGLGWVWLPGFPWMPTPLSSWMAQPLPLSALLFPGLTTLFSGIAMVNTFDQFGIDLSGSFGWDGALRSWNREDGWQKGTPQLGAEAKLGLWENDPYFKREGQEDINFRGKDIGDLKGEVNLAKAEAGAKVGVSEDGFTAGAYGEFTTAEAEGVAVVGSSMLGIAGAGRLAAGSAEAFIGIKDNDLGASIGGSLVSAEAEAGLNIAGANVGIKGGISLGFELGFKIGDDTEVKLGPFKVGLSFGKAK